MTKKDEKFNYLDFDSFNWSPLTWEQFNEAIKASVLLATEPIDDPPTGILLYIKDKNGTLKSVDISPSNHDELICMAISDLPTNAGYNS